MGIEVTATFGVSFSTFKTACKNLSMKIPDAEIQDDNKGSVRITESWYNYYRYHAANIKKRSLARKILSYNEHRFLSCWDCISQERVRILLEADNVFVWKDIIFKPTDKRSTKICQAEKT